MGHECCDWTLTEALNHLKSRDISSAELTQVHLERIQSLNTKLNCFLSVNADAAKAAAADSDRRLAGKAGGPRPLEGAPISLKDNFVTKGIRTTCASRILGNFTPPYEGTPSGRLKDAGAVLLGKLNMDEFAMGSSNENSAFGPVRNPWDVERAPGGSSGGSATALAARLCMGATGTDTGGSIRQPASFCGIVGMRPTYGRVSRYGIVAFASSLDQAGPMARTVEDCARLLKAMAGFDERDSTSAPFEVPDYPALIKRDVRGMRLGVPKEYFQAEGLDPEVRRAVNRAIEDYRRLGVETVEISLPHTDYAIACYYVVATAEASSNLARYDGIRYGFRAENPEGLLDLYVRSRSHGFGAEVKRRIMLGTYCLSAGYYDAYYRKAMQVRTLIRNDFLDAFKQVDAVLTPTSPTTAFKLGEKIDDPLTMYLADIFTVPCNLAGLPGLSLPCGMDRRRLPIGLQLMGKPFKEEEILALAYAYEQSHDWHSLKPEI